MRSSHDKPSHEDIERHILEAIRAVKYGAIEVVIHDSRVVQVEKKEKTRFGSGS